MAAAPNSVQKSEEEWRTILSPEQFSVLRQKGTDVQYLIFTGLVAPESLTSFTMMGSITVLDAELLCTNPPPNLTLAVVGLLSLRVSQEPLTAPWIQMVGGLKSHVLLVVDIWAMYSKVRGSKRLQMKDTVSTVFRSSSSPWKPLVPCEIFHTVVMQEMKPRVLSVFALLPMYSEILAVCVTTDE